MVDRGSIGCRNRRRISTGCAAPPHGEARYMAQHGYDHSRPHRTGGNVPPVRRRVDDSCCRMDLAVVLSRVRLLPQLLPENGRIETERFADVLEAERPRAI